MIDENNEFVLQLVTMSHCDSSPIKKSLCVLWQSGWLANSKAEVFTPTVDQVCNIDFKNQF